MPGDERKFKRRRIIASIPTCKRDRELAASHTFIGIGITVTGVAVRNSLLGVIVGEARSVGVMAEVLLGGGIFDSVGEDIGITVAGVVMDGKVSCGDEVGFKAVVDISEAEAVGAIAGVGDIALAGRSDVEVGATDKGIAA